MRPETVLFIDGNRSQLQEAKTLLGTSPTGLLPFERRVYFSAYERIAAALLRN